MKYDAAVVGGGMAGLTAAAYLARAGFSTILFEKDNRVGGLVKTFNRNGFVFDGGIRAIESSGIILPMLSQLGIKIEFFPSSVSVGYGRDIVRLDSKESLGQYRELLYRKFPDRKAEIREIVFEISKVMDYMDVLYGIDNPLFLEISRNLLPWLFKYLLTIPKINRLKKPVDEYLRSFTQNQAIIDMVAQHFFQKTPTYFALSYFSLYLDYRYPKGGTGTLPQKLAEYIIERNGDIRVSTEIQKVDPVKGMLVDKAGKEYSYGKLVWAADSGALVRSLDMKAVSASFNPKTLQAIEARRESIKGKRGSDSILSIFYSSNLPSDFFGSVTSPHLFFTPSSQGLSANPISDLVQILRQKPSPQGRVKEVTRAKERVFSWIGRYFDLTTFEISIPAMRDPSLAPAGKSGVIVSTLFDRDLVKHLEAQGWYGEFKDFAAAKVAKILDDTIFAGFAASICDSAVATPLTLERMTGNLDGAITGWAFTNPSIPAETRLLKIAKAIDTPIPGIYQAGQWSFSPAGLPISILTGKLAADKIIKEAKRNKRSR